MAIMECSLAPKTGFIGLARVLLVDDNPASRLTLQSVLKAGGYYVDFNAGGGDCANKVGAAISVIVNGQTYGTGQTVGGGAVVIRLDVAG